MDENVQKLYVTYFAKEPHFDMVRTEMKRIAVMLEASPVAVVHRDYEPLPRPAKVKSSIKQAPRQSFRKVMRSVNRNR